jgi:hypothetical protein
MRPFVIGCTGYCVLHTKAAHAQLYMLDLIASECGQLSSKNSGCRLEQSLSCLHQATCVVQELGTLTKSAFFCRLGISAQVPPGQCNWCCDSDLIDVDGAAIAAQVWLAAPTILPSLAQHLLHCCKRLQNKLCPILLLVYPESR